MAKPPNSSHGTAYAGGTGIYQKATVSCTAPAAANTISLPQTTRTTVTRKTHGELKLRYVPAMAKTDLETTT